MSCDRFLPKSINIKIINDATFSHVKSFQCIIYSCQSLNIISKRGKKTMIIRYFKQTKQTSDVCRPSKKIGPHLNNTSCRQFMQLDKYRESLNGRKEKGGKIHKLQEGGTCKFSNKQNRFSPYGLAISFRIQILYTDQIAVNLSANSLFRKGHKLS